MTKNSTPSSTPSPSGIDPITTSLDNLSFQQPPDLDDDSAESLTPRNQDSDLHGESTERGVDLKSNFSMPDDTSKRNINGVSIMMIGKGDLKKYCCGYVGIQKNAFCTKLRGQCDTVTHLSNKFIPEENRYYIHCWNSRTTSWCQPCASEHLKTQSSTSLIFHYVNIFPLCTHYLLSDQNILIFHSCVKFSIILPLFPLSCQFQYLIMTHLFLDNPISIYLITIKLTTKYVTNIQI